MRSKSKPPKIAKWLLNKMTEYENTFFFSGDLQESFEEIAKKNGLIKAKVWYWSQVISSLFPYLKLKISGSIIMFINYIKIGLRTIKRHKGFSFINIAGLAIGIACTILILLWVRDELSYDNFHKNRDQIYRVIIDFENGASASTCGALAPALKQEIPEIINSVRLWHPNPWQMYYDGKKFKQIGNYADPSIFEIFSFPLLKGNQKTALIDHHSIVLNETIAEKLFSDEEPLGKTIFINNRFDKKEAFIITGVIQNIPKNSHIQFDFLFSFNLLKEWYRNDFGEKWTNHSFPAYVLTQKNISLSDVNNKISECYNQHENTPRQLYLQPLKEIYLNSNINNHAGGDRTYVNIFSILAFFILLIACINYMNLATARSAKRSKEVGLRKVVGAEKKQIIYQYFVESVLNSIIALPVAIFLIALSRQPFNNLTGKEISINYFDPLLFAGLIIIVLLTGLISGLYPALYLSSFNPARILGGTLVRGKKASLFRKILVVFQFSLSIIVIIATVVVSKQLNYINNRNLGFDKENLIYTWTSGYNNDSIRNELLKNPNIINVGGSGAQLDWIGWWQTVKDWEGKSEDFSVSFAILEVGYEYLSTYGMEMAEGRFYSKEFISDEKEAIVVNESAIKAMKLDSPIGKIMSFTGQKKKIVGVVKDFHFESLHSSITPILFVLYPKQLRCLGISVKQDNITETLAHIKNVLAKLEPDYVLDYQFLDEQLNKFYLDETRRGKLFNYFSFISIFISCLGLFGLASFATEQRKKEIGVRKVLGASPTSLFAMLSREFIKWIFLANCLAWPIAYYFISNWLQNFAYKIDLGIWIFILSGFVTLLVALITISYQTIKAAIANPIGSLKYE